METWIILEPAPDEEDFRKPDRQQVIESFYNGLTDSGTAVQPLLYFQKSVLGGEWLSGEFILKALPHLAPIATLIGGYLVARAGRKVRVKIGDKEIEAGSVEEVERLITFLREQK